MALIELYSLEHTTDDHTLSSLLQAVTGELRSYLFLCSRATGTRALPSVSGWAIICPAAQGVSSFEFKLTMDATDAQYIASTESARTVAIACYDVATLLALDGQQIVVRIYSGNVTAICDAAQREVYRDQAH